MHMHSTVAGDARVVHISFLSFITKSNGAGQDGVEGATDSEVAVGRWSAGYFWLEAPMCGFHVTCLNGVSRRSGRLMSALV